MAFVGFSSFRSPFFNYFFPEPRVMSLMFLVQVYPPRRARCHVHADSSPSMVSSSNARDNEATELTHTDGRADHGCRDPAPERTYRYSERQTGGAGLGRVLWPRPLVTGIFSFPSPPPLPPLAAGGSPESRRHQERRACSRGGRPGISLSGHASISMIRESNVRRTTRGWRLARPHQS